MAQSAPPVADTFVSSTAPSGNGGAATLNVNSTNSATAYIQFSLATLPPGTPASSVNSATLRLFVTSVTTAGSFDVFPVNASWTETGLTYTTEPMLLPSATGGNPVGLTTSSKGQFVLIDITSLVREWVGGTLANNGLALVGTGSYAFDSKESTATSHQPELEISLAGDGPIGLTGPTGPTGAQGAQGTQGLPGSTGATGAAGTTGSAGVNSFTTTTASFTQPAGSANVTVPVVNSTWMAAGQIIFVATGGNYKVVSLPDSQDVVLQNVTYPGNAAPGTVIPTAQGVMVGGHLGASGVKGDTGATGATGATGVTGANGTNGATGPTSAIRHAGANGANGTNGLRAPRELRVPPAWTRLRRPHPPSFNPRVAQT